MDEKKQVEELIKILMKSNAISYEPNARPVDLYLKTSAKEKFYVSDNDGHLTIDYSILAKDVYKAGYYRASDIFEELDKEITLAIESNYKVIHEYTDRYERMSEELLDRVRGKIDALRGIEDFVAELRKKYESEGNK